MAWNIKPFSAKFFYDFIQTCLSPIAKWCFQGSTAPIKTGPNTLRLDPHMMTLKSSPNNLCAPLSPINITTMIRQHAKFPPCTSKPVHEAIHYPTANFGPLLRGSVNNQAPGDLGVMFDTNMTPKVTESLVTRLWFESRSFRLWMKSFNPLLQEPGP